MARSERPAANRPGPMPPYQAVTMIAGMNGVPRIPGRLSASVVSNARATLAIATPYLRINETDRPGARRRLQIAPLMRAAQEECLEAGGPLTSLTSPEHSRRPRTTPFRRAPCTPRRDDDTSSGASVHSGISRSESTIGRRWLELPRSGEGRPGLYAGFALEEPLGVRQRKAGDRRLSCAQVEQRAGLSADQGALGLRGTSDRSPLRV